MPKKRVYIKIELSKEKKEYMLAEIKAYYKTERNEEIGDLAAVLFLDFIIDKIAPEFYNQGVADSYKFLTERLEEIFTIQK